MSAKPLAVVTGAAGFIGSHMVDLLLAEGCRVHAIDNLSCGRLQNLAHHDGHPDLCVDVRDLRSLAPDDAVFQGVRWVFHFAGIGDIVPSIDHPIDYLSANVMGTVHALEASRYHAADKFIYAASSSCYGLATQVPTREDAPIDTQYPYALSKYFGEQAAFHWNRVYRLPVVSIRMFNVYGPRSRTTGAYGAVFGVFLKQKLAGTPFTIVGDGTQTRDFVFATDVARAYWLAANSSHSGEVYNLGAGAPQSVNRLVELLGGGEKVYLPKRPGEPACTWADISKARAHFGWEPTTSIDAGVAIMLRHIEHWRDAPLWDAASIEAATAGWFKALVKEQA